MAFKLSNSDNYETINEMGITKFGLKLNKETTPIAFENKVQELMEENGLTREEAENVTENIEFHLEIYYEKGTGLFAVESEAVESGTIYSPYTTELGEDSEEY